MLSEQLTKYTHIRDHPLLETSLFFTMSYCTFLAAEAAEMTGMLYALVADGLFTPAWNFRSLASNLTTLKKYLNCYFKLGI